MAKHNPYACYTFPNCGCYERLCHWSEKAEEWIANPVPEEIVREGLLCAYFMYLCIEANCHRPGWRRAATLQLMHPVWTDLRKEYP